MLAALRGDRVDEDWLGKLLRGEEIGGYIPRGHPNSLKVWEAVEYYARGWSLRDVGEAVNWDSCTVFHWFKQAGIPRRPGWGGPPSAGSG